MEQLPDVIHERPEVPVGLALDHVDQREPGILVLTQESPHPLRTPGDTGLRSDPRERQTNGTGRED